MSHVRVFDKNDGEQLFEKALCTEYVQQNRVEQDQYINPIVNLKDEVVFFVQGYYQALNLTNYSIERIEIATLSDGDQALSTLAIDSNGNIYFGTERGDVVAIDPSGVILCQNLISIKLPTFVLPLLLKKNLQETILILLIYFSSLLFYFLTPLFDSTMV